MENEVIEIIQSIRTVIDDVMTRIDAVEKRQLDLEHMLFNEILDPTKAAIDDYEYNERLDDFKEKVGDKFDPYVEYSKSVNGDDYDLYKDMFDGYDNWPEDQEKPPVEDYIEAGIENLKSSMEKVKEALGAETVEMKIDENGDVETTADGEEVPEEVVEEIVNGEENPDAIVTEEVTEEIKLDPETAEDEAEDSEGFEGASLYDGDPEEEATEEEIQADLEMLEKEMEKYR